MKSIGQLNGWMGTARPSRSVTSILMASSAVVIAESRGPIMDSMHTKPNVLSVAMCMEQTGLICSKGGVPSVREGRRESGTGGLPRAEIIRNRPNQIQFFPLTY